VQATDWYRDTALITVNSPTGVSDKDLAANAFGAFLTFIQYNK